MIRHRRVDDYSKAGAVDEQQLISACRASNRDAQRRVYDLTVDRIYRLVLRMVGNVDDAFDLTNEVYVRVFNHIESFRSDCSLATWIHRIAVNQALAFTRRKRVETTFSQQMGRGVPAERDPSPVRDARLDVQSALSQLDADDRMVLLLRYDQGLDYRGMARILDCAEGTVASRLNRARSQLRALLQPGYGEREENTIAAHPTDGRNSRAEFGGHARPGRVVESAAKHSPVADGDQV